MNKLNLENLVKELFRAPVYKIELNSSIRLTSAKRDGRPSKPLILPKSIDLDKDFMIGFGIYFSEGTRVLNGVSRVEASNSEYSLLQYFIYFMNKLGVKKKQLRVKIGIYEQDAKFKTDLLIKKYWSSKLKIPIEQFQKVTYYNKVGKKRIASRYGVAQIRYYNTNMVRFMPIFTECLIRTTITKPELLEEFVKGIIASEGHIELRKDANSLKAVYVACKKTHNQVLKFFRTLGIEPGGYKEYNRCIRILGIKNFSILFNKNLLEIHPEKYLKFINGIKRHRFFYKVAPSRQIS